MISSTSVSKIFVINNLHKVDKNEIMYAQGIGMVMRDIGNICFCRM